MSICEMILETFEKNKGVYISGAALAKDLGISRNAVWKNVRNLQAKGYEIKAVTNKGYILSDSSDILSAQSISKYISDKRIKVEYRDCVTSTNMLVRSMAEDSEEEGLLLVAAEQTQGKGRLGRSFSSQKGTGVYFSLLLRPELSPSDSLLITTCAAVAVSKAINEISGKQPLIKWVNDIYLNDRKVCGILTQAAFDSENNKLAYAVLGIGINISFDGKCIPEEIRNIAGSVFKNEKIPVEAASRIIGRTVDIFMSEYDRLTEKSFLDYYRKHSYLDGKEITVIKPDGEYNAVAVGINDDLSLEVRTENGETNRIFTGEVSTRVKGDKL